MKLITALFFTIALLSSAAAQSPSKVLKQAEKALGSKALQNIQSITKTGRVTRTNDGATGKYVFNAAQPNLFNESMDLGGFEIETGANGRSGWTRNSRDGLNTVTGDASNYLQTKASFRNRLWFNAKNDKSKLVAAGTANIDGKSANIVSLVTAKGVTIKMYFDVASGLLVRDEIPAAAESEINDYTDYRDVGGTKQAFSIKSKIGGETYEIKLDDVKLNAPVAKTEFDFPNLSGQPLPDIPSLLKQLQENEDKVEKLLDSYSFVQNITEREQSKDGKLLTKESKTYQMSFYKGNRIRRLIEKDGKPLSPKDQAEEDKDAAKRVEEIDKEIAKREAKSTQPSENDRRISFAEMLRASNLINPRRERFRGRDVIVFDFEPNPSFDFKNAKSMIKFFGKTVGVIWVDEHDKQVARIEAMLADNFNIAGGLLVKLKKGATFTLDKERVNDEIWLPSQADINLSLKLFVLKGIDLNQVVKTYDYRKFETEVKDAKVGEEKKP